MAVAVLLPVYRGDDAEHFALALDSISAQSGCTDEVRIYLGIDGPLDPAMEQVIRDRRDALYRVVRSEQNVGPTEILNRLIGALGDERLVFRMDADDIALPERMARQIDFMDRHPDIDILGTAMEEFDSVTGETVVRTHPTDPEVMRTSICFANPLAHPTVCIRPRVLEATRGYPPTRNQDLALWFEALAHGFRISNLPEPLLRLRVSHEFFHRRRTVQRAWPEFMIYMRGIRRLHGLTWRYIYPVARLVFRLASPGFARHIYRSGLRNRHVERGGRLV